MNRIQITVISTATAFVAGTIVGVYQNKKAVAALVEANAYMAAKLDRAGVEIDEFDEIVMNNIGR